MREQLTFERPDTSPVSIFEQTPWECGSYVFPPRHQVQYFNPSLADWQGSRWLVTRRRRCAFWPAKNDLTMWRLQDNIPTSEHPVKIPTLRSDEHWEDPRATVFNGQLWLSFSNFYNRCYWVHQAIARVNSYMQGDSVCHPIFGDNRSLILENTGHEKNWLWFVPKNQAEHDGKLLMVYSTWPHTVVRFDNGKPPKVWESRGIRWRKGAIRGGTPPIYVPEDNLFWSFFHSSIDLGPTAPRRMYFMGAYAFEPDPPFRIVRRISTPLLTGSAQDPRDPIAPLCVFPCGALLDGDMWHVTLGVNDCGCAWFKIPHEALWERTIRLR